ncbi:myb-like protein Z [Odontomachus brunneus]|uniref:myb-like protein Z n=1 Tax=Odontomachus brunneus TaxID=486640 RepID=UPI0013F2A571|nr:myb-like protein Z [Odontomachus brunneus]
MKRSPLSTPSGPNQRKHTPYNWNSHENANKRGYTPNRNDGYQCFSANDGTQQISGDDFIPLDMSTPVTQYKKNNSNWHSPRGGRNNSSPDSGGCYNRSGYNTPRSKYNNSGNANARCNYRNNYYTSSRSNSNSSYSPYKQPFKQFQQFHKQRKNDKGTHRQVSISEYIDMPSCLKDPWEHLMKKLNNSNSTSDDKTPQAESSSNLKLVDNDFIEKPDSNLPRDVNLNDSHCSQESKVNSSLNTTFGEDTVNVSQTSKTDSSVDLEISSICFNQNSVDENTSNINDNAAGATEEKEGKREDNIRLDSPVADTDEKNI